MCVAAQVWPCSQKKVEGPRDLGGIGALFAMPIINQKWRQSPLALSPREIFVLLSLGCPVLMLLCIKTVSIVVCGLCNMCAGAITLLQYPVALATLHCTKGYMWLTSCARALGKLSLPELTAQWFPADVCVFACDFANLMSIIYIIHAYISSINYHHES